ncbi:hypothetical protein A3K64_01940 [Candidatus Micrarchaeota archaeon RBG_16_36_9]|nr:MAG: hypothetical protein A3K64_01940 [Candidatus Micrarchaeota archaeon RBG_16_36_9]
MDISIIVPALNEEKLIGKCLGSLREQNFSGKYEIIVVDGHSEDRTVRIARKYADKILTSPIRNVSFQRNLGAKYSKGNILAFADADTVFESDWLSKISENFLNKDIVAMTGSLYPLEKNTPKKLYIIANKIQKFLIMNLNIPLFWGASCAFEKGAFFKIGGFNENLSMSEDHDISLRIRKHGKVFFNSKSIAYTSYRRFKKRGGWLTYIIDGFYYLLFKKSKKYSSVR